MELEFNFSRPATPAERRPDRPLRMLIMGDFSGHASRSVADLADRPLRPIDIDSFDTVLAHYRPELHLTLGPAGDGAELRFSELDDFHPDRLYRRLELFDELREIRRRLADPASFNAAAAELLGPLAEPPATPQQQPPGNARDQPGLNRLLHSIVQQHIVAAPDPRQAQLLASVDQASADLLRRLLHADDFQALEATWRGVRWLIDRIELDTDLQLFLLDAARPEIAADFDAAGDDLSASALYRSLIDGDAGRSGGQPWTLIVGLYSIDPSPAALRLLAGLGLIAARAGGSFLAAAAPQLVGCEQIAEQATPADLQLDPAAAADWAVLRRHPAATTIGLVLPRLLLRLPYGQASDPIDMLEFEELSADRNRDELLWGNGALACAALIGQSYRHYGWAMRGDELSEIDDLPAYSYRQDGESRLQAAAEVYLSERAGTTLAAHGLMPLLSQQGRNAVRLARLQSIAEPAGPLLKL